MGKVGFPRQICPVCMRDSIDGMTHSKCLLPQSLNGVYCIWENKGVVKKAIKTIKYRFADDVVKSLAKEVIISLRKRGNSLPTKTHFVPIPLHERRYKWRGFNHAEEIGKYVAKYMGYKFSPNLIWRTKEALPQADLKKSERAENVRGVFAPNKASKSDKQMPVIVFDDVWTTGATMREAGKVLKRNGFEKVWGLTVAH